MTDVRDMAKCMEEYAQHLKAMLPKEHQAIIDALVMSADIHENRYPRKIVVARLRAAAMRHKPYSIVLASHMEVIANELERTR
ncbi:MAG: hypothetical protein DI551_00615 [Micavibrio aeruginosavorus]|uniref:Uncharacterized protein n=1 Tax=Micavibrio aeruginosavorus TaxID=349221 RepID=A0A2W5N602_9BACT|nr:MAG: hypothetical protein DI551_00615 [Micavibrio aeruginosavorus]